MVERGAMIFHTQLVGSWKELPGIMILLLALLIARSPGRDDPSDRGPLSEVILVGQTETERAPHGEGNIYPPEVVIEGDLYRMWYGGQGQDGHDRIHLAESNDSKTWTRRGVVLDHGEANHVNDPSIVKVEGNYFLYYTRAGAGVVDEIAQATSQDGIRDGEPAVEFSWEGTDGADVTPLTGRGWAVLRDDELHGMIFIHLGDESEFEAERAGGTGRPTRR
jgi:hypothetical protein